MILEDLINELDTYLEINLFNDYCPNGLQVEGKREVQSIATAVSADLQTIEAAIEKGVDALIVHHGLFWKRDSYRIIGSKKKKIERLLEHQISLLAYHLPLDAHRVVGNNWKAAHDLGWESMESFGEIGVKGRFSSMSIELLVHAIEKFYRHSAVVALGGKKEVKSAALISGGAYKDLAIAAKEGVDCFITGNFDEPAWAMAHEEGVNFLALGHSATEKIGPKALGSYIGQELGLEVGFIDTPNPF